MCFFLKDTRCKLTKGIINSCNIRVNKKWIYSAYFDFHGENKIGNWCNFLSVKERANKKKLKVFVAYLGQIFRNNNFILHPHIFYKSYFLRLHNQTVFSLILLQNFLCAEINTEINYLFLYNSIPYFCAIYTPKSIIILKSLSMWLYIFIHTLT